MGRSAVLYSIAFVALVTAIASGQDSERVVPVHQEPRHRMVFESGGTRILHLQIHPGDASLWHTHKEPILYVNFGDTTETRTQNEGAPWSKPVNVFPAAPPSRLLSSTTYYKQQLTHRIENVGKNLFELIAVLNLTAGDGEGTPASLGFSDTPELTNNWFRAYRFSVPAGQSVRHTHAHPVVVIQTSAGVGSATGNRLFGLNGPSSWSYFAAKESHELRNLGSTSVELVEVEVREP